MKIHVFSLLVFFSVAAALGAQPAARPNKEPAKKTAEQPPRGGAIDEQPTFVKVEVGGVLRVSGKLRKIKEMEAPANINSPAQVIDKTAVETGAVIETRQMGSLDVYFGGAEGLQEKAKSLNGKPVILLGSLERLTFYSKQDKDRFPLIYGGGGGANFEFWVERPARVTKNYIRVTRLEAAEPPDLSKKAPAEPIMGEPSSKQPFGGGEWTAYTIKRMPKAKEVTALRIIQDHSGPERPDPLTAANFPALLDGMTPIKANDEKYRLWHYAAWYRGEFETAAGTFRFRFYLGGLARLQAPDGKVGFALFEH